MNLKLSFLLFSMILRLKAMTNIYLIVAPSGAGKTAITERLEEKYGLKSIQSYTTRPPRYEGETGHTFISDEEFDRLTDIVAYTEFCGNRYAATAKQVNTHDLYVIDPKGIEYFREKYNGKKNIKVIYVDSDLTTRYERMTKREEKNGSTYLEAVDKALRRITNDITDFYDYIHGTANIDFVVENDFNSNLDAVVDKVYEFICSCENE